MRLSFDADPAVLDRLDQLIALQQKGLAAMSQLSDAIAAVGASLEAALVRVDEDVQALQAKITELEALVAQGTATPEDLAALAALQAKLDALDPTKPDTLPA